MKKLYFIPLALALFFMSNRGGRSIGTAGAPGESGATCASCHNGGNFDATIDVSLTNTDGEVVSDYIAGQEYDLTVTLAGAGAAGYGFQLVPLTESDNEMAGSFSDLGALVREQADLGRTYIVQSDRKEDGIFTAKWTAPTEGSGDVKFYAAGIAANGNNGTGGDQPLITEVSFAEETATSTDEINIDFSIFPNPTADFINVSTLGEVDYIISSIEGRTLQTSTSAKSTHKIDVAEYESGMYLISIIDGDKVSTRSFMKR